MQAHRADLPSFLHFVAILLYIHRQTKMSSDTCPEMRCIDPKVFQPGVCNLIFVLLISSEVSVSWIQICCCAFCEGILEL